MWILTRAFLNRWLVAITGGDSISLGACSVGLAKAPITPSVSTVLADITEADYTGYARQSLGTMEVPWIGPEYLTLTQGTLRTFRPTTGTDPNTIYAGILTGHGADSQTLFGVEVLEQPVALVNTSSLLTYVPRIGLEGVGPSLPSPAIVPAPPPPASANVLPAGFLRGSQRYSARGARYERGPRLDDRIRDLVD